jgi:Flp pilus assembly protein TadG
MKIRSSTEVRNEPRAANPAAGGRRAAAGSQRGGSLVEMAFMMTFLMLLLIGVIDMGRAFYLSMEVADAARAGAQYGYESAATMSDSAGISTAANADAPDVSGLTVTSSHGCMCSDGSGPNVNCGTPPTCSSGFHVVNYVKVNTAATYTTLFPWPKVPGSFALTGTAQLVAGQ